MSALEVNGPANIVDAVRLARLTGRPINLDYLEAQALATIEYMKSHANGKPVPWHIIKPEPMPMLLELQCESGELYPAKNVDVRQTQNDRKPNFAHAVRTSQFTSAFAGTLSPQRQLNGGFRNERS